MIELELRKKRAEAWKEQAQTAASLDAQLDTANAMIHRLRCHHQALRKELADLVEGRGPIDPIDDVREGEVLSALLEGREFSLEEERHQESSALRLLGDLLR